MEADLLSFGSESGPHLQVEVRAGPRTIAHRHDDRDLGAEALGTVLVERASSLVGLEYLPAV
jgi:hypothetical protein